MAEIPPHLPPTLIVGGHGKGGGRGVPSGGDGRGPGTDLGGIALVVDDEEVAERAAGVRGARGHRGAARERAAAVTAAWSLGQRRRRRRWRRKPSSRCLCSCKVCGSRMMVRARPERGSRRHGPDPMAAAAAAATRIGRVGAVLLLNMIRQRHGLALAPHECSWGPGRVATDDQIDWGVSGVPRFRSFSG